MGRIKQSHKKLNKISTVSTDTQVWHLVNYGFINEPALQSNNGMSKTSHTAVRWFIAYKIRIKKSQDCLVGLTMDIQHTYYTVAFIILTIMTHLHRLQIEPTHSTRSHRCLYSCKYPLMRFRALLEASTSDSEPASHGPPARQEGLHKKVSIYLVLLGLRYRCKKLLFCFLLFL